MSVHLDRRCIRKPQWLIQNDRAKARRDHNEGYDSSPLPGPPFIPSSRAEHLTILGTHEAIIQRVLSASVTVDKEVISSIGKGVLVFAAVAPGDTEKEVKTIASKILKMKLWDDESGGKVSL